MALLICYSAHNSTHAVEVNDLYPTSSNYSVRFVSFRIILISAWSWPSQHSCFFGTSIPRQWLSILVLGPSMFSDILSWWFSFRPFALPIAVASLGFWQNPPAGISWSRNQFFPITSGVSCSRKRPGSHADVGIHQEISRVILCRLILNYIIIHIKFLNDIIMFSKIVWHFYVTNIENYVV